MTGNTEFRESILHMKISSDTVTDVYTAFSEFSLTDPLLLMRGSMISSIVRNENTSFETYIKHLF